MSSIDVRWWRNPFLITGMISHSRKNGGKSVLKHFGIGAKLERLKTFYRQFTVQVF